MLNTKAALRRELLPLRKAADYIELNISHLSRYSQFLSAKTVFCYVSSHGEIDTRSLIFELLKEKNLVVPYCTDMCGNMICVQIHSPDDLKPGKFGIPEPQNPIEFPKEQIDFAIVPGIAFDMEGYRLGYGKGYYDRFLKNINPFKLGVCAKEFYAEKLPHDNYDIMMNDVLVL